MDLLVGLFFVFVAWFLLHMDAARAVKTGCVLVSRSVIEQKQMFIIHYAG